VPAPAVAVPVRDVHGTERCPRCSTPVAEYRDQAPWCPQCEWNLDAYRPVYKREGILGSLNRRAHAIGFRQGPQIVRELSGQDVPRPVSTAGSRTLVAVSILLYAIIAMLLFGGAWLISRLRPVEFFARLLMVGIGWSLRPRLGSRRQAMKVTWELSRAKTPGVFALVDRVAAEIGGHTPHTVAFGVHWNMTIGRYGLRRREVLTIGLPLFVSAQPQERIALLAHELAHQVNRDARRGLLTQPAIVVFGRLSQMTRWRLVDRMPAAYVLARWSPA
jgi:heat shock protein HtpX